MVKKENINHDVQTYTFILNDKVTKNYMYRIWKREQFLSFSSNISKTLFENNLHKQLSLVSFLGKNIPYNFFVSLEI